MHVILQAANEDGTHAPFAKDQGTANMSIDHGDRSLTIDIIVVIATGGRERLFYLSNWSSADANNLRESLVWSGV